MRTVLLIPMAVACATPAALQGRLQRATDTIEAAQRAYGTLCAPETLANAQAHLDFTRLELSQGHLARADEHLDRALAYGTAALTESTPCGGVDTDGDFVPDIVDECPTEPEDPNGNLDRDGCPDARPVEVPLPEPEAPAEVPRFDPDWMFEPDQPDAPAPPRDTELENRSPESDHDLPQEDGEPAEPPSEPVEPPSEPVEPPSEPVEPPSEPVEPPVEPVEPEPTEPPS